MSVAARKLQIDVLSADSAKTLKALEGKLGPHLADWREIAQRDAEYLIAMTRIHRQAGSAARKAARSAATAEGAGF